MKSTWIRGVLGGGVLTAALFISGHALAGVSNPAYYTVNASDMEIYNNTGSVYAIADTGTIEGDLASDGSFAYNASSFAGLGTTSISTMKSKFVIGAGGTSGVIDPFTKEVSFTLHMKIQFSGTGPGGAVSTTCQTSFFNVTISTTKTSTPWASSKFDPSNGGFLAVAQDFTIPQVRPQIVTRRTPTR